MQDEQQPYDVTDDDGLGTDYARWDVGDMGVPTEATLLGRFLWGALRIFALLFSAVTTAAFYWKYSGNAFTFLFGNWSPYITALAGMLALDGASQVWAYLRGHKSDTVEQMAIARAMTYFDLMASVLVTIIFLVLNAGFDVGIVNADGSLTSIGFALNITGVLVLTAGIVVNFVAATVYSDASAGNRQAVQGTQLAAVKREASFQADLQSTVMTTRYQLADIMRQLPDVARQQGVVNSQQYLGRNFNVVPPNGRMLPPSGGLPAAPSNGRSVPGQYGRLAARDDVTTGGNMQPSLDEIVDALAQETGRNRVDILNEMLRTARSQTPPSAGDIHFFN